MKKPVREARFAVGDAVEHPYLGQITIVGIKSGANPGVRYYIDYFDYASCRNGRAEVCEKFLANCRPQCQHLKHRNPDQNRSPQ